jgi:hypothetical protein
MAKTASDVAKALLPGWSPIGRQEKQPIPAAIGEPTVHALCKKYGIKSSARTPKDGLQAASVAPAEFEFVVMAPPAERAACGNKVVVVANGKVVAVQG